MAGFENAHGATFGEAVREWRWGRFAPLYAAGILGGIGLGFTVATWPTEPAQVREHVAIHAPAPSVNLLANAPVIVLPEAPLLQPNPAVTTDLPLEWYLEMEPAAIAPAPAVAEPAPIVPAAKPVPAVAPPSAPPAPAVQAAAPAPAPAKPNFYVPAVSGGGATALELDLLQRINAERAAAGLQPYTLEAGLTKVARTRSQQLIDQNYFAHRDPFGYSMYVELLAHFGYSSYAWAGENLAMNNWPAEGAAAEAMNGLMNSPTHRANILAGDFFRIGIGEITTSDGRHFFTMIFLG